MVLLILDSLEMDKMPFQVKQSSPTVAAPIVVQEVEVHFYFYLAHTGEFRQGDGRNIQ